VDIKRGFAKPSIRNYRIAIGISLSIIIPLGFASKFYRGPGSWWVIDHAGGLFYEIFWILLIVLIWLQVSPLRAAVGVFIATAFLEFLQLWHPPILEAIRATSLGRTLIGTTFDWWDFLHYILGCAVAWRFLRFIRRSGMV